MSRVRRVGCVATLLATILLLLGGAAAPVAAQEGGSVEITGIDISEFPQVQLRVALSGAATGVDPETFAVTENGQPVEAQVTPLSGESVAIVLAIDTSGSMQGEPLAQAKVAAVQLLEQLPGSVPVAVVGFGAQAQLFSTFTTERATSQEAINTLTAGGGTALYDAVVLGAEQAATAGEVDRSALVVLTDGADSDSAATIAQASDAATRPTDFYTVALQTAETDQAALTTLAEAAGGRVVNASDPAALSAAYVELGQQIVNQFQVAFTSATTDPTGTFAVTVGPGGPTGSVEIALPDRPGAGTDAPPTTDVPADERALPPLVTAETEPSIVEQDWVLFVGAGLIGIAIAATAVLAFPTRDVNRPRERRRLSSDAAVEERGGGERALDGVRAAATRVAERAVERTETGGAIDSALDKAGIVMRAGEFVAAVLTIALVGGVLAYLILGAVLGAVFLLAPMLGAKAFLEFKRRRRNAKFADQLSDTLLVMAGSLRSGFGVGQAIDTVAEEMDDPMSAEFQRALLETRLGRDIEDALQAVAARVQNEDFEWVVDAMRINRQVGGDLASLLDQVSETIRARNRLKRQVAALTAEGRVSAYVLSFLPIGLGLVLYASNPDYLELLFTHTVGNVMLGFAVALLITGGLWLKKMIDIEY